MDEDEGPHEDVNEHEMSEKLVTLIKAGKNLMKVVTKSVQMTAIGHFRVHVCILFKATWESKCEVFLMKISFHSYVK